MTKVVYSHCVQATAGKPDAAPWTDYEPRTIEAELYRIGPNVLIGETDDSFACKIGDRWFPARDTKEDAVGVVRYMLMDESRSAAEKSGCDRELLCKLCETRAAVESEDYCQECLDGESLEFWMADGDEANEVGEACNRRHGG